MRPSGEIAIPSKPAELLRFAAPATGAEKSGGQSGDLTSGSGIGASRTLPVVSVWTRKGPNSSPNHSVPPVSENPLCGLRPRRPPDVYSSAGRTLGERVSMPARSKR